MGGNSTETSLEQRVVQLENRLARLRLGLIAMGAALCALVAVAASDEGTVKDVLRTRELQVVNSRGKTVAAVRATRDGNGLTQLFNKSGHLVVATEAGSEGGALQVNDGLSRNVVGITTNGNGGELTLRDNGGRPMYVATATQGSGKMWICDRAGRAGVMAGVGKDGYSVSVHDETGQAGFMAGVGNRGGWLAISTKAGEQVVHAYADENGRGFVGTFGPGDEERTLTPR